MEAEVISNVNRSVVAQSRVKAGPSEGGTPRSSTSSTPVASNSKDRVSLSSKAQDVVVEKKVPTGGASSSAIDARRELELTDGNQVVLKIKDSTTNKVIKQIPNEEEVRLREAIKDSVEDQI